MSRSQSRREGRDDGVDVNAARGRSGLANLSSSSRHEQAWRQATVAQPEQSQPVSGACVVVECRRRREYEVASWRK